MKNVVTIIAAPSVMSLNTIEIDSVVDALQGHGAIVEDVVWLSEGKACDIFFAVLPLSDAEELFANLLAGVPFDFIVQDTYNRRKKLLISDMDSTIIQEECIDELAAFAGLKDEISAITERAMNGELDFKEALKERVAKLEGLPISVLSEAYENCISVMPGAKELVATMKENGAKCILVSGGFTFFTERIKTEVGFDLQEANILKIADGILTGKVREPILDKEAKLNSLLFHAEDFGIRTCDVLAVGDGANDLPMIQAAGLGVAYHAKPNVKKKASAKIDTCDLTALLYAQGYCEDEITS